MVLKCGLQTPKCLQDPFRGSEWSNSFDDDSEKLFLLFNVFTFNSDAKHIEDKTTGTLAQIQKQ